MKKILYVEDDTISALIVEKFLKNKYEIMIAKDEDSCLQLISELQFDLVLMDISLGDKKMGGVELLKQVRTKPGYKQLKIVAVTAFSLPQEKKYFLEEGFDALISKPIQEEILTTVVMMMLS
jgi:two-component system sensor histidine kinase BarA